MKYVTEENKGSKQIVQDLSLAIKQKCKQCESDQNLKKEEGCQNKQCPLYNFRDKVAYKDRSACEEAIFEYCIAANGNHFDGLFKCYELDCPLWLYRFNDDECILDSLDELTWKIGLNLKKIETYLGKNNLKVIK
jgi:hypothetical protein